MRRRAGPPGEREATELSTAAMLESPGPGMPPSFGAATARDVLRLQRVAGNSAAVAWVQREFVEEDGSAGVGAPVPIQGGGGPVAPVAVNEAGDIDVGIGSDTPPQLFKNKGKQGVGLVGWVGGPGGKGQQVTGSANLVAPTYSSAPSSGPGKSAKAWVNAGTGKVTVVRSYLGVQLGANQAYYFTKAACKRADVHEKLHVTSSRSLHDTHIKPLEKRIDKRLGAGNAIRNGVTAAQAEAALKAQLNWNGSVTAFATADQTANNPMGTTDTVDMARADFIRDKGPRKVNGVDYAHYIDVP